MINKTIVFIACSILSISSNAYSNILVDCYEGRASVERSLKQSIKDFESIVDQSMSTEGTTTDRIIAIKKGTSALRSLEMTYTLRDQLIETCSNVPGFKI